MTIDIRRHWLFSCGAALLLGCATGARGEFNLAAEQAAVDRAREAAVYIQSWPPSSALAARRLTAMYGTPDEVHPDWLVWNDNRPWKRTVVRITMPVDSLSGDRGVIEQTVEYKLTRRQLAQVKEFDPRLSYDRRSREFSSISEREEVNFLRMNLANDIVNGRMTTAQARVLFAQILRLEAAGKSSSYLQVLFFPR